MQKRKTLRHCGKLRQRGVSEKKRKKRKRKSRLQDLSNTCTRAKPKHQYRCHFGGKWPKKQQHNSLVPVFDENSRINMRKAVKTDATSILSHVQGGGSFRQLITCQSPSRSTRLLSRNDYFKFLG